MQPDPALPALLQAHPYFAGMAPEPARAAARRLRPLRLDAGAILLMEGDACPGMFFVASGRLRIYRSSEKGREQILRIAGPGESFNEVPVFDGGPNPASVDAMEDSLLYAIGVAEMQALIGEQPALALGILRVFAEHQRALVDLVEQLALHHVASRVARLLLGRFDSGTRAIDDLPQQQLGAMVGAAREVVARVLKTMEDAGAIENRRGHLLLRNRSTLESFVED